MQYLPAPATQLPLYPSSSIARDGDGLVNGRSVMRGHQQWQAAMPARGLTLTIYPTNTTFSVSHNQCLYPGLEHCLVRLMKDLNALQCGL